MMEAQEAKELLGIIGLGACCDACATKGVGADRFIPKVSAATTSMALSPRTTLSPTAPEPMPSRPVSPYSTATPSQETAGGTLRRMQHEQATPSQPKFDAGYQWATLNEDVWIGGHKFPKGTRIVVSLSQKSTSGGGKAHTTSIVVKVWAKFGQTFDSSSWIEGGIAESTFTLTGQSATWSSQTGFGAPRGGGGGHHGGGIHRGGGFHRGGGSRRGSFGPWWGGGWWPDVLVVEQTGCQWTGPLPVASMPPRALAALLVAPKQVFAERSTWQQAYVPMLEGGDFDSQGHGWYGKHTLRNGIVEYYVCTLTSTGGLYGLGMEYTETPKPGDYHVNGNGVVLRASPLYKSNALATLQNGENVYLFGDVETDPDWRILKNDTVEANTPDSEWAGIDYVRVGTQTHGAGWIAMPYIEPGAGTKFGAPQPKPAPTPTPSPSLAAKTNVWPWVLGGSLVVLGGGAIYLLAKKRPSRTAATYRMRTA